MSSRQIWLTHVFLFFAAAGTANSMELWKSDGTTAGTTLVKNINPAPGAPSQPYKRIDFNGALFFVANDGPSGYELWISDEGAIEDGTEVGCQS